MSEGSKLRKREKFMMIMLVALSIIVGLIGYLFFNFYGKMVNALTEVKNTQVVQYEDHVETRQFLLSTIDWETKRQKTILFMRDIIIKEWQRCGYYLDYNKAYLIAEANMIESEKYPQLEPFLLLAMQWKESSFIDTIVSPVGAVGLMQIMPPTGRLLAGFFQLQYSRKMLLNFRTSIKFGAKYVDVLFAEYNKTEVTLAAYNGGYWGAYYYKTGNERLAEETANYIPMIMDKITEYQAQFQTYKIDEEMNIK